MIPTPLQETVETIRKNFQDVMKSLESCKSFQSLIGTSDVLRSEFAAIKQVAELRRLQQPCDSRVVCTLIGSSNHGKTTLMEEMFPELHTWLITDSKDATAQSLRLSFAADPSAGNQNVTITSWDLNQIIGLVESPDAKEQNERSKIRVACFEDHVEIDGTDASIPPAEMKKFKFPRKIELWPFARPYVVSQAERTNVPFIRALTTKQEAHLASTNPILAVDGKSYDILQLRTLVKDIALQGSFEQVKRWAEPEEISNFVFVDTPGLATSGNVKDEVLMHCLAQKSSQIVLQLLKDDELDIIIHLVLCGEASAFSVLSRTLERELGPKALDDLAERMILAVTGTHRYLVNPDLKRKYQSGPEPVPAAQEKKWYVAVDNNRLGPFTHAQLKDMASAGQVQSSTMIFREGDQKWFAAGLVEGILPKSVPQASGPSHEGDHFSTTLEDNILNRMGLGNRVRPARICFLDCRKFVETYGKPYDQFFAQHRAAMLQWLQPGSAAYETLTRLDLLDSFAKNVESLCRSDDRGQGFLIRQIIELIKEKGPFLFVKKYLSRTKLRAALKDLGNLLSRYYDENGRSNRTAIREAIQKCLHFLDPKELNTIEVFAAELDPQIDHLIVPYLKNTARRNGWIPEAFQQMTNLVFDSSIKKANVSAEAANPFKQYLNDLCESWLEQWGYRSADLEFPSEGSMKHWELVKQTLKVHCREMLYQLVAADRTEEMKVSALQSAEDQEQMRDILHRLGQTTQLAETVCNQHGAND